MNTNDNTTKTKRFYRIWFNGFLDVSFESDLPDQDGQNKYELEDEAILAFCARKNEVWEVLEISEVEQRDDPAKVAVTE